MTNQIIDWIREARKSGMDDKAITLQLQKTGWAEDQIQSALKGIESPPPPPSHTSGVPTVSTKHRKLGIIFILLPFGVLMLALFGWAITTFVYTQSSPLDESPVWISIVQWALGLIGLLGVMSILVLVPLGIYFLHKKTIVDYSQMDPRSGKGDQSVIPAEIHGWNWGAALLTWIWGIGNSVWLALFAFAPIVNIIWWIVLGINGNEWAWKARAWESVEQFKEIQRKWTKWALIIFGCYLVLIIAVVAMSFNTARSFTN